VRVHVQALCLHVVHSSVHSLTVEMLILLELLPVWTCFFFGKVPIYFPIWCSSCTWSYKTAYCDTVM